MIILCLQAFNFLLCRQITIQNSVDDEAEDVVKSPKVVAVATEAEADPSTNEAELAGTISCPHCRQDESLIQVDHLLEY